MGPLGHSLSALAALAGVPVGALALVARPSWRGGWRQRLGALDRSVGGGVWVHAASVGETRAARPLLLFAITGAVGAVVRKLSPNMGRLVARDAELELVRNVGRRP